MDRIYSPRERNAWREKHRLSVPAPPATVNEVENMGETVLRVGCAMWADRSWVGPFFPADTPNGHELASYATWCSAVEGNTTFYGLPTPKAVARWAEDAPSDFRFMFKLPRTITHERRLRNADVELDETLDRLAPLGPRARPLAIQLPASFEPADVDVLDRFLRALPTADGQTWGVEVRHPAFCQGGDDERRLNDLLAIHRVERIIIDTRAVFAGPRQTAAEREAFERKPRLPVRPVAIGPNPIVRFIGQTEATANPHWWQKWVPRVVSWLVEGRSPTVFIHTPDNAVALPLARRFHAEVVEAASALHRLPVAPLPTPVTAAAQLRLV